MALRGKGKKQDWAGGRLDIFPACPTVSAEQAGSLKEPRVGGKQPDPSTAVLLRPWLRPPQE